MKETIHSASPVVHNQNSQHHLVRTVSFEISPFGTFWCSSISLDQVNLCKGAVYVLRIYRYAMPQPVHRMPVKP